MSRVSGTFSYGNATVHRETNSFDEKVQRSLDGTLDQLPDTFENWSPERVKEAIQGLQRADENLASLRENADAFAAQHAEYLDTKANGETLNRTLKALFGECVHTPEQFEKAYEVCRANNLLQLDRNEIARQEAEAKAAARKQRTDVERSRIVNLTEEELETMPLEEIRRLDAIERQRQMQRRGEEGGW